NKKFVYDRTPLHSLVMHCDIIEVFLVVFDDPKLDVNSKDMYGVTPFGQTCYDYTLKNRRQIAELFIERFDIDVNSPICPEGMYPLEAACNNGDYELIDLLLNHPLIHFFKDDNR